MIVFIGNLPAQTPLLEIKLFIGGHPLSVDYSLQRHDHSDCHFLLVKCADDRCGEQLIREINGKSFHGARLEARRCHRRRQESEWQGPERRNQQLNLDF